MATLTYNDIQRFDPADWPVAKDGRFHVVGLSGGKDSTALALALSEFEPRPYIHICTPTGDELPEVERHWDDLGQNWLTGEMTFLWANQTLNDYVEHWQMIPNRTARWCTRKLKTEVTQAFVARLTERANVVKYVGLRADEPGRAGLRYNAGEGIVEQRFPLQDWRWDVDDVWRYLDRKGIRIPKRTDCARCFFQTIGEWWELWANHPERWAAAERQELRTNHTWRTRKFDADGNEVFERRFGMTFASSHRDSWPAWLADLRKAFEAGHRPKTTPHPQDYRPATQETLWGEAVDAYEAENEQHCGDCRK